MTFELRAEEFEGRVRTGRGGIQLPDLEAIDQATPPHRPPEEVAHSFMSLLWDLNGRSVNQRDTLVTRVDGTRMRTAELVIPNAEFRPVVRAQAFYIPSDFNSTDSWVGVDREVHVVSIPSVDGSLAWENVLNLGVRHNTPQVLTPGGRWESNHYSIDHGEAWPSVCDQLRAARRRTHKAMDGREAYRADRTEYRKVVQGLLYGVVDLMIDEEELWDIPGMAE